MAAGRRPLRRHTRLGDLARIPFGPVGSLRQNVKLFENRPEVRSIEAHTENPGVRFVQMTPESLQSRGIELRVGEDERPA